MDSKMELERLVENMRRPKNVLLVEDDIVFVDLVESFLRHMNLNVTVARTPEEAIAAYDGGKFNLALVDLVFPPETGSLLDGIDVIKYIRSKDPISPPVVLLTGYPDHQRLQAIGDIGGPVTVVPKPCTSVDFPLLITSLIRSGD